MQHMFTLSATIKYRYTARTAPNGATKLMTRFGFIFDTHTHIDTTHDLMRTHFSFEEIFINDTRAPKRI